jgi:putative flippase GtrA
MLATMAGRLGLKSKEAGRFLKFAVVGAIGFVVDFGVFNLLMPPFAHLLADGAPLHQLLAGWGLTADQIHGLVPTFAGAVSFVMAIISNFIWNRYWTYPDSRSKSFRRQFAQFVLVSLTGIIIRTPIITFTHRPFSRITARLIPALASLADPIGKNMALVLAVIVVMFWNFFVNRYWTYNDVS